MHSALHILLSCLLSLVLAGPNGAPESSCNGFRPHHMDRTSGTPIKAQNDDDDPDNDECPYEVTYGNRFIPGERVQLNITAMNDGDYFAGFMLTIVDFDPVTNQVTPKGNYSNAKTICNGHAVTHSNNQHRRQETIEWIAPADGSGKKYAVWLTVVKSYSKFWLNCNPILIPAFDAVDVDTRLQTEDDNTQQLTEGQEPTSGSNIELNQQFDIVENATTEGNISSIAVNSSTADTMTTVNNDNQGLGDKNIFENNTENMSSSADDDYSDDDDDKTDTDEDDASDSKDDKDSNEATEDSDGDGDGSESDESGNSIENSFDLSDDRSGSSLTSDEKEVKRKEYLEKGIEHFDKDVRKLLKAANLEKLLGNDGTTLSCLYSMIVLVMIALLL